jgi:hypothetical protein
LSHHRYCGWGGKFVVQLIRLGGIQWIEKDAGGERLGEEADRDAGDERPPDDQLELRGLRHVRFVLASRSRDSSVSSSCDSLR